MLIIRTRKNIQGRVKMRAIKMKMPTTEKQATGSKNPETKKKEWAKQDFKPSNRNQKKGFLEKYFGF